MTAYRLETGAVSYTHLIYLSHEKSSYARPQQTVLLHIDDVEVEGVKTARAVFDGDVYKRQARRSKGRRRKYSPRFRRMRSRTRCLRASAARRWYCHAAHRPPNPPGRAVTP